MPLCSKPVFCRGWCGMHYNRWRLNGNLLPPERRARKSGPGTVCKIPDCGVEVKSRGLCGMHYTRWKNHRDPLKVLPKGYAPKDRRCSIEGCENKHNARGWCHKHYQRWKRWGDPTYRIYEDDPAYASEIGRRASAAVKNHVAGRRKDGRKHGKSGTYGIGCRCDLCRAAEAERKRRQRRAKKASVEQRQAA